ncbi:MAG: dTMP kinase [Candidatus Methanoperedens sp.]|nr:dTMP kinase [Candidatus Methanoperedens sp.]
MDKKPFFIVFEGIDGSGKGTQAKKLVSDIKNGEFPRLANVPVKLTMEPTNGMTGKLIRKYLIKEKIVTKEQRALLFAADRLEHLYKTVFPILNKNGTVISERYIYSTLAYQSCEDIKLDWSYNLYQDTIPFFDWLCVINQFAIPPDLTILLDVDPHKSLSRFKSDSGNKKRKWDKQEYFEKGSFLLEKIREKYLEIFEAKIKSSRSYGFFDTNFVIIDASKDQEEVYKRIKEHVNALLKGEYPEKSKKYLPEQKYIKKYIQGTLPILF